MLSVKLVGLHASPARTLLTFITRNKTTAHVEGLLSDRENQDYSAKPCRACKRIKVSLWTMDSTNVLLQGVNDLRSMLCDWPGSNRSLAVSVR